MDIPSNSFTSDGKDFQVNCIFQVWVREDQPGDNLRLLYSPAISVKILSVGNTMLLNKQKKICI